MVFAAPPPPALPPAPAHVITRGSNPAPYGWTTHRIARGDTLSALAVRYRTTIGLLAARNRVRVHAPIYVGQVLLVPRTAPTPTSRPARSAFRRAGYVVRPGDTLTTIAARYGTTVWTLARLNHLSVSRPILIGQRLTVLTRVRPAAPRRPSPRTTLVVHRVRSGDTLGALATRYHTTVPALMKTNHLPSTVIRVGQRLAVRQPVRSSRTGGSTFLGRTYPVAVVRSADRNRAYLAAHPTLTRAQTRALIVATARRHGVDPRLALAVAWQESGWDQRQVSPANAVGVMQVIPDGGEWASSLVGRRLNLLDVKDNVTAGVVMLRALNRMAASQEQAVAGYYQGLGSVRSRGMYADTRAYVRSVLALQRRM